MPAPGVKDSSLRDVHVSVCVCVCEEEAVFSASSEEREKPF